MATIVTRPFAGGRLFDPIVRFWARSLLFACGASLIVKGQENVDFNRHYIYVSNHASLLDIPAVVAALPDKIRIVYKRELNLIPLFGWAMYLTRMHIGIDRSRGMSSMRRLESDVRRVTENASLLLFAEGTRTPDGALQPFKRGAFNLAVRASVGVVPLTILGSRSILPKHSLRIKPGKLTLVLDKPIDPKGADSAEADVRLMEETRSIIERHFENAQQSYVSNG